MLPARPDAGRHNDRVLIRRPAYGAGEPGLAGKDKKAHYIAVVKQNQPLLYAQVKALPWRQVPAGSSPARPGTAAPRPAP